MNLDIYLDNNATTRMRASIKMRLFELLDQPLGNPSSPHSWGQRSREVVEAARFQVAAFLGCFEEQVLFTSCASEANTLVMRSFSPRLLGRKTRVVISAVEHPSVFRNAEVLASEGADITILPVDSRGIIKQEDLARALDIKTDLVSIQWVNNETGVIQDIPSFSLMAHNAGALFHTDAVQAVGKLPIDLQRIPIDFLSLTGHKLHAPQGVGALFVRQKKALIPLLIGGDQEHKLRAGTENILGIAALGFAIEDRMLDFDAKISYLRSMRDLFEHIVLNGDNKIIINGTTESRVVNTSNLRFSGIDGRPLIALLDQEGVVCSQSSACTSSIPEPSHVLMAMGLSEDESYSSIRFSFSVENSLKEAEEAAKIVLATLRRLRATYKAYLN